MNRNPYIWAVVNLIEAAPAGKVLQFRITRRYRHGMKMFCKGVRRNVKRHVTLVVANVDKRVLIAKVRS